MGVFVCVSNFMAELLDDACCYLSDDWADSTEHNVIQCKENVYVYGTVVSQLCT